MQRVLVTGAAGRIGTVACALLAEHGARVTALSDVAPPAGFPADRVVVGDTRSEADVAAALEGADLVVHLAARPHRTAGTPYEVYTTNVVSTFNVLAQAAGRGIRRAVVAGSINAYGLPQNDHDLIPAYFPIDEHIPRDISDWYSLSKHNDESASRMVWRHWGMDVVTLRFPHVNSAAALAQVAQTHADDPRSGLREAWSYLDTRDAARAIALGLIASTTGAHALFLAARTTSAPYRTEDLLDVFAPDAPRLRRFPGREVPMDLVPSQVLLGFEAHHELELPTLDLPGGLAG
ncbi:NAD-dependent epimerase/dehydratase family protein [Microbacterium ulmi]|nr:NAD(P)-dependent oxidoreductase [Microbacterium ulmi]NII69922.1 nucleoside-diphosphate-sugar epimerase [Microbacterium ulmi]